MKVQILVILRGGIWKEPEGRSKYQTELTRLRLCRRTKELKWSKVVELVESRRGGGMVGVEFQELFDAEGNEQERRELVESFEME